MWALLFGMFPQLISGAITAYNKSVDASVAKYKVDGTVDIAALQAQVEQDKATRDIVVAEQGHWFTRLPRPVMGMSVAVYVCKVLVWDKVLAVWTNGSTDSVNGYTATMVGIILGGYFLHGTALEVVRQLRR